MAFVLHFLCGYITLHVLTYMRLYNLWMRPEPARATQRQTVTNRNLYFALLFLLEHSDLFLHEVALIANTVCISDAREMKFIINQHTKNKQNNRIGYNRKAMFIDILKNSCSGKGDYCRKQPLLLNPFNPLIFARQ